jgi:NAD(P)-dependent dehydrogenase (short-subunit alcohol dehydrogenase family)
MSPSTRSIELAQELGGIGLGGSVTNPADLQRLVETTMTRFGRIDAVVNGTGNLPGVVQRSTTLATAQGYDPDHDGALLELPDEIWSAGLEFYLLNVVRMSRLVTPIMERLGGGAIVNLSSAMSLEPRLIYPVSSVIRLALAGFAKLYADRYARAGIRMNNVLPGYAENRPLPDAALRTIPMPRLGRLAEIAKTVCFLLSDDSGYVTGQNIRVDGGLNRGL